MSSIESIRSEIYKRNYQIGTCFICQKCLYCGESLISKECSCNKDEKPSKNNRTNEVQFYRGLCYHVKSCKPIIKEYLYNSNLKFGYETDFSLSFSCSLCSACNSKISRENNKNSKKKNNSNNSSNKDDSSELLLNNFSNNNLIEVLQIRILIKKDSKTTLPFILINWPLKDLEFVDFLDKIETLVSEHIGLVFRNDYILAYKSSSENGAGTLLDNEITFTEFLNDYRILSKQNKKVIVIVTLKQKEKKNKRECKVSINLILQLNFRFINTINLYNRIMIPKLKQVKNQKKNCQNQK
jgi:hypothetical protein